MPTLTGDIVANFEQVKDANGLGGRTVIATLTKDAGGNVANAEALAFVKAVAQSGGNGSGSDQNGPDAFTVAAVSGVGTDTVTFALQGTGTLNVSIADHTVTTVATFA